MGTGQGQLGMGKCCENLSGGISHGLQLVSQPWVLWGMSPAGEVLAVSLTPRAAVLFLWIPTSLQQLLAGQHQCMQLTGGSPAQ